MSKRLFASRSESVQLDFDEPITHHPVDVPGTLLRVRPHESRSPIADAVPVFQSVHDVDTTRFGKNASDHYAFECWFHEGTIEWYVHAAMEAAAETFRRRLAAAYPDSDVTTVEGSPAFPAVAPEASVAGARLSTAMVSAYPLRQHDVEGFETDPYGPLTTELFSREDSSVVVQILFRPAKRSWADGDRFKHNSVEAIADAYGQGTSVGWLEPRTRPPTEREERIAEVVADQRGEPAFHVTIRVAAISPERAEAERRVRGVSRVFETMYSGLTDQAFVATPVWSRWRGRHRDHLRQHLARMAERAWVDRGTILTVDELVGVAHLPSGDVETAAIDRAYGTEGEPIPAGAGRFETPDRRRTDGGTHGV